MSVSHKNEFDWTGRQDREDGPTARRFYQLAGDHHSRGILGFACDEGVARNKGRIGAAEAPTAIRKALVNLAVPADAKKFTDLGDITVSENALEDGHQELSLAINGALDDHDRVLVLGGGHETAFGCYTGVNLRYPNKQIGIINLDAHLDLRAVGESGASSGTPFYQIRELQPLWFDYLCLGVAAESNTDALLARAKDWGVGMVSDHDLISDPKAADEKILEMIHLSDVIYLTIDLDVLPHYQMPGVSAPAARGVPLSTIERLVDLVLKACAAGSKPLPVADIVELSPPHDRDGVSAKTAAYLARKILLAD